MTGCSAFLARPALMAGRFAVKRFLKSAATLCRLLFRGNCMNDDDNKSTVEMWLWMLLVMQPHNRKTGIILRSCGNNLRRACIQMRDGNFPFLSEKDNQRIKTIRLGKVRELQRLCAANGISIVTYDSDDYPEQLRLIENPPIVLFVQGNIRCLKEKQIISAVGTRKPSEYSVQTAQKLCGGIARSGAVIVSGLAVGLDTVAHEAALKNNGITAGILACGNLVNYPAESKALKERIVKSGGVLISELLPDTATPRGYFQMRNRIISGIADQVIVLEASEKSGALLTANNAFEQRRHVFFVPPHDLTDERYSGAALLYKKGATPVFYARDIVRGLSPVHDVDNQITENIIPRDSDVTAVPDRKNSGYHKRISDSEKAASKPENSAAVQVSPQAEVSANNLTVPDGLDDTEKAVYKVLVKAPADVDSIVAQAGMYYREVVDILLTLEISGAIVRHSDGTYSIA